MQRVKKNSWFYWSKMLVLQESMILWKEKMEWLLHERWIVDFIVKVCSLPSKSNMRLWIFYSSFLCVQANANLPTVWVQQFYSRVGIPNVPLNYPRSPVQFHHRTFQFWVQWNYAKQAMNIWGWIAVHTSLYDIVIHTLHRRSTKFLCMDHNVLLSHHKASHQIIISLHHCRKSNLIDRLYKNKPYIRIIASKTICYFSWITHILLQLWTQQIHRSN